jgi:hypothetical protein
VKADTTAQIVHVVGPVRWILTQRPPAGAFGGKVPGVVMAGAITTCTQQVGGAVSLVVTLVALVTTGAAKVLVPLAAEVTSDSGGAEGSMGTAVAKGISGSASIPTLISSSSCSIVISAQLNSPLSNRLLVLLFWDTSCRCLPSTFNLFVF